MTMRQTGTLVLVLGVLVFAGSAYAGNGNGNENGNGGAASGNSANAPGQMKKDAPAAAPETTTSVTTVAQTTTPVPAPANATGVKPSNETAHDTYAEAQSDKTKQYGNGQTAGQIAEKNGAKANAVLHGPGNSQPHKAGPCSGGHEVDVHALKAHRSGGCGGDPRPHPQPGPTPAPDPTPGPPAVATTTTATPVTTTVKEDPSHSGPGPKQAHGEIGGETAGDSEGVLASATRRRCPSRASGSGSPCSSA
jgi:hypothetical protein